MPQIFSIGPYLVYFWSNESKPLEPVHVHVSKGTPEKNATKIWITRSLHCLLCNNNAKIPSHILGSLMEIIENRAFEIVAKWQERFGEVSFYC